MVEFGSADPKTLLRFGGGGVSATNISDQQSQDRQTMQVISDKPYEAESDIRYPVT